MLAMIEWRWSLPPLTVRDASRLLAEALLRQGPQRRRLLST
jgi:hypothetical protein